MGMSYVEEQFDTIRYDRRVKRARTYTKAVIEWSVEASTRSGIDLRNDLSTFIDTM